MAKLKIEVPEGLVWLFGEKGKLKEYLQTSIRETFEDVVKGLDPERLKELQSHV
jgi:hypothetical protein